MADGNSQSPNWLQTGLGILGGVSPFLGSLFSNIGANKRQEQANQWNMEFWQMQNKYNHPSAQMKRLRESGLNPHLIYGSSPTSATGNAGAIAPSKAAPYEIAGIDPLAQLLMSNDIKVKQATTNNLEAQNNVLLEEAGLKAMMKYGAAFDAKLKQDTLDSNIELQKQRVQDLKQSIIRKKIDNQVLDETKAQRIEDASIQLSIAKEVLSTKEFEKELRKYEVFLAEELGTMKGYNILATIANFLGIQISNLSGYQGRLKD